MSSEDYRTAFIVNHARLVRKLTSFELLQATFTKGLITQDEKDKIEAIKTDTDRLNKLLGLFHRRYYADRDIFKKIFKILEEINTDEGGYIDHVIRGLNEVLEDPPTSLESHDLLNEEDRARLRLNEATILATLDVYTILPDLISEGVVSPEESETIVNIDNFQGRAQKFLSILTSRSSESFQKFLNILIDTEVYEQLAYKLKGNEGRWDPKIDNDKYDCSGATGQPNGTGGKPEVISHESHDLKAFHHLTPNMLLAYGQDSTLCRLAGACWADSLIDDVTHDTLADNKYEGEPKRAQVLVKKVYKKVKKSTAHLKTFAQILRDEDFCHKDIANEIEAYQTANEYKHQATHIADSLQGDISQIASRAMAEELISYTEYIMIADGSADHSMRCAIALFDALDRTFKTNPKSGLVDKFFKETIKRTDDISNFSGQYLNLKKKAFKGEPF